MFTYFSLFARTHSQPDGGMHAPIYFFQGKVLKYLLTLGTKHAFFWGGKSSRDFFPFSFLTNY